MSVGKSPAAVSQHLAKLRLARIVTTRHEGNRVFYRLANEHALELVTDAMFQAEHSLGTNPRHHRAAQTTGPHDPPATRRAATGPRSALTVQDGNRRTSMATTTITAMTTSTAAGMLMTMITVDQHPTGMKGFFYGLFVPHSHDAADSVDDALEASPQGIRAVKISLDLVGDHRDVADRCGDRQRVGGVAGRHDPQLLRRADRGAVVDGVRAGPTRGDAALHLRLRPGRGPGRAVHRA